MKVFKFDPETGRRGAQVANVARASWADAKMSNYAGAEPTGFGSDANVEVHCDAGITDATGAKEITYRHATEWRCFCIGNWHVGVNDDGTPEYSWEWWIVPPLNVHAEYRK